MLRSEVASRAVDFWHASSDAERREGCRWYDRANETARTLATAYGGTVQHAANVLAITSPNQTWKGNVTLATRHLRDGWIGGLPSVRQGLTRGTPNGRKVQQFAKAIAGDDRAVVIDRWMIRAFGEPMGRKAYPDLEDGITDAADKLGISPRDLQATIWCHVRGSHE